MQKKSEDLKARDQMLQFLETPTRDVQEFNPLLKERLRIAGAYFVYDLVNLKSWEAREMFKDDPKFLKCITDMMKKHGISWDMHLNYDERMILSRLNWSLARDLGLTNAPKTDQKIE